jgi:hemolysin activation/secretion protein
LTGDSGFAGRLELQYNQAPGEWLSQYQLYGFYDLGRVWNRDRIAGTEAAHASLSSTGLGTRFYLFDAVTGSLEGALPLTRKVNAMGEDGSAPRVFFNLQYRF